MARLCVIFTGLCMLVRPAGRKKQAVVLLRRVSEASQIGVHTIAAHQGLIRYSDADSGRLVDKVPSEGEVVAVSFGPHSTKKCRIDREDFFIPVGLDAGRLMKAKDSCVQGASPCSGLLSGKINLSGGTVSPLELADKLDLGQVSRTVSFQMIGTALLAKGDVFQRNSRLAANGFLWERELDKDPSIVINGVKARLAPTRSSDLGGLATDSNEQCFVVWIINTSIGSTVRTPLFDPDFHLLYDLVDGVRERLVPLVRDPSPGEDPGDPPARCMPAIATA